MYDAERYDAVIIGAGMSGLAAGIRLAHFGKRVCILERHTTIGGLNSFYRLGGRNYDVGLHAVTNFTPKGTKRGPLARLLRQLRMAWEDLELSPQLESEIAFPQARLRFSNDFGLLESEVGRVFPDQRGAFARLVGRLLDYDDLDRPEAGASARGIVEEEIGDPLLVEMLFCPLMYYGSAREEDMEFGQFSVMFKSVFQEGFARPRAGVRAILKLLTRRYKELGGELRLRAGVRRIVGREGEAAGVELENGDFVGALKVISSAGWPETMRLCGEELSPPEAAPVGQLSFIESISILDRQPRELGYEKTIVFFNDHPKFEWRRPSGEISDVRSGVICSPNNFAYAEGPLEEGVMRITALADFTGWQALSEEEYREAKRIWYERMTASAVRFVPDFRGHVTATDMFTPTTIRRFTGHELGAVYGAPVKRGDGTTHVRNLFLCGTDQGWVGIVGTIVSGIMMANRHVLAADGATSN